MFAANSRPIRAAGALACALACVLALATPAAAAEQWVTVQRTADGVLQLDASRIARVVAGDDYLEVRTRTVLTRPAAQGASASVARLVVHCGRNTSRTLSTEWVDAQGRPLAPGAQSMTAEQAVAAMRGERIEYSARLAPLCSTIAAQVARSGVIEPQPPAAELPPVTARLRSFEGASNRLLVRLNDSVNTEMTIDPRAPMTTITKDLADTLRRSGSLTNADVTGRRRLAAATGKPVTVQVVRLKSVRIENQEVKDVEALVLDQGAVALGRNFLERLGRWSINPARQTFEFVPPAGSAPAK